MSNGGCDLETLKSRFTEGKQSTDSSEKSM